MFLLVFAEDVRFGLRGRCLSEFQIQVSDRPKLACT